MQKRDFIQQAAIEFMPHLKWEPSRSVQYAERLWAVLSERGYGDSKPTGQREMPRAYDELDKFPVAKAQFDLFWAAFDHKYGRDRAAARWMLLGDLSKQEYAQIIAAAKREAAAAKNLPEGRSRKMAEGWLSERRWLDHAETSTETVQKQASARDQEIRKTTGDLNHAKQMAEQTGEEYWACQVTKLTEQLRKLRNET